MTIENKEGQPPAKVNVIVDGKEANLVIVVKKIVTGYDVVVEANKITKGEAAGILSQIVQNWAHE